MKCRVALAPRARPILLVLMDVDGVLTDGAVTFIGADREAKTFDARDGVGIWIARRCGLRTGVISGRGSEAVLWRAAELGMEEVHTRVRDKLAAYRGVLRRRRLRDDQVCYIGDDLVDLPILGRAGMPVAVRDAHAEVVRRAAFVTGARGGRGAVREVIDAILKAQGRWDEILGWFGGKGGRASRPGRRRAEVDAR